MAHLRLAVLTPLIALFCLAASSALAEDTVNFLNVNESSTVDISYDLKVGSNTYSASNLDVYAGAYNFTLNGSKKVVEGFCTDVYDEIFIPETWKANAAETASSNGLVKAPYPYIPPTIDIDAIDYIAQTTLSAHGAYYDNVAPQLAIWDLMLGGSVVKDGAKNNPSYAWGGVFSAAANDNTWTLGEVYGIEQTALTASKTMPANGFGSNFEDAIAGSQPNGDGRPQDMVFATPEGTMAMPLGFLVPFAMTVVMRLRRCRRLG